MNSGQSYWAGWGIGVLIGMISCSAIQSIGEESTIEENVPCLDSSELEDALSNCLSSREGEWSWDGICITDEKIFGGEVHYFLKASVPGACAMYGRCDLNGDGWYSRSELEWDRSKGQEGLELGPPYLPAR